MNIALYFDDEIPVSTALKSVALLVTYKEDITSFSSGTVQMDGADLVVSLGKQTRHRHATVENFYVRKVDDE